MIWSDSSIERLKELAKRAEKDRGKFNKLVMEDKEFSKRGLVACTQKAQGMGLLKGMKRASTWFVFDDLTDAEKEELKKLLSAPQIDWAGLHKRFPKFDKKQLRYFASRNNISIAAKYRNGKDTVVSGNKKLTLAEFKKNITTYADKISKCIRERGSADIDTISSEVNISSQMVYRAIKDLIRRGFNLVKGADGKFGFSTREAVGVVSSEHDWRPTTRILIWSGSEFGSKGQQADLVKTVYHTIVPEEKPDFIIALGNMFVGALSAAKRNETFLKVEDYKTDEKTTVVEQHYWAQIQYVLDVMADEVMSIPGKHQCNTYFISGLREQTFIKKGYEDPMEKVCWLRAEYLKERGKKQDWFYYGRNMHMFRVVNTGEPVGLLALTSKKTPFRGAYTRGHRPKKTSASIAGWLINTLRTKGVQEYPHILLWTDGVGIFTHLGDSEASKFSSLPKLAVTDPTELELDTPPNLGCLILDITFTEDGRLKPNSIECKFRNLAPYVQERGY